MSYYKLDSHKFCYYCGTGLVKTREYITRYDDITGEAIMRFKLRCPRFNWFGLHFIEEFEGEDMIVSYDGM